jgi:hypothetical protein
MTLSPEDHQAIMELVSTIVREELYRRDRERQETKLRFGFPSGR